MSVLSRLMIQLQGRSRPRALSQGCKRDLFLRDRDEIFPDFPDTRPRRSNLALRRDLISLKHKETAIWSQWTTNMYLSEL